MQLFIILAALLSFTGCSKEYMAEREFWKAERLMSQIKKADLEAQGTQILDPVATAYQKVFEKYPGTVKAVESLFVITNIRLRQKNTQAARETLQKIIQNFSSWPDRAIEAREGLAKIYEVEGAWDKAETAYWELAKFHPLHPKGLYAPVHMIIHYKKVRDPEGQKRVYSLALDYYEGNLKTTGPIQAAAAIKNYLALAKLANGDWQEARTDWLTIPKEFPESPYAPMALLAAGELSQERRDIGSALDAYNQFLTSYGKHPLVERTTLRIGLLHSELKEFAKAREWFNKLLVHVKEAEKIAQLKLLIGQSYQNEGNWEEAEKIYHEIETQYPNSGAALQVPLFFYTHMESLGETEKAQEILDSALQKYQEIEKTATDPAMSQLAQRLEFSAYAEKGDWKEIMSTFDENMAKEQAMDKRGNWLIFKAFIAESKLKDLEQAKSLYQSFLSEYANHPLANYAKTKLEALTKSSPSPSV
ncbi:MAG: tetratricopeptide repeat protein [Candidatus Omnitrophica bacterium]|nr:tetratricopeptide repeat protein [Candidatus Omnitrophota bacterium]